MARTAVIAGTATAVAGGVAHHQQQKWNAQEAEQQAESQQANDMAQMQQQMQQLQAQQAQQAVAPAAAAAPAAGGTDIVAELEKLQSLKAAGILDDAEFAAAKAKLLA
jgi:hypothetical protein